MSSGPPVLLIHGQPGGIRDWDRVTAALDDPEDAIAYYRPGWDGARAACGFRGNAEAAIERLDAHRADRAIVVGHSFGGGVAAWLAVHHPERVAALVLAAPAATSRSLDRGDRLLAAPLVGPVASAASLGGIALALSGKAVRRGLSERTGLDEAFLLAGAQMLRRPRSWRSFLIEQRALFTDVPALESRLHTIESPTIVITGANDPIVSADATRLLATQIPNADLVEIDRAGHLLPHLHADELAAAVRRSAAAN